MSRRSAASTIVTWAPSDERLAQFATDASAAENDQPGREVTEGPPGVAGQVGAVTQPVDGRHQGLRSGGEERPLDRGPALDLDALGSGERTVPVSTLTPADSSASTESTGAMVAMAPCTRAITCAKSSSRSGTALDDVSATARPAFARRWAAESKSSTDAAGPDVAPSASFDQHDLDAQLAAVFAPTMPAFPRRPRPGPGRPWRLRDLIEGRRPRSDRPRCAGGHRAGIGHPACRPPAQRGIEVTVVLRDPGTLLSRWPGGPPPGAPRPA